jgi:hypothetical protein
MSLKREGMQCSSSFPLGMDSSSMQDRAKQQAEVQRGDMRQGELGNALWLAFIFS